MRENIYLVDKDNNLSVLSQTPYENETLFQDLIEKHPELLAGEQIDADNPRKWIFISREMAVPIAGEQGNYGYLDHLFIDQDAILTFVEVKRSTDARIRREVVGQMMDYAANAVVSWPIKKIREKYEEQVSSGRSQILADIGIAEEKQEAYWQNVSANLKAGRLRLLFVADVIPLNLQRIIEFLNEQMSQTEVLGLEIRQYLSSDKVQTLVPQIVGQTVLGMQAKGKTESRDWDEESFLENARTSSGEDAVEVCRQLLRGFRDMGCSINFGRGKVHGSIVPIYNGKIPHQLCAVIHGKNTVIEIYSQYYKAPYDTQEKQSVLIEKFRKIPGITIAGDWFGKRPNFSWEVLSNAERMTAFLQIFREYIDNVKEYESTL